MSAAPKITVRLVHSSEKPTGVGEAGTIVTPAALANAIASLTGERLRHIPFTANRIKSTVA
jgi:isoquinoline 1-oxidoreductase beta subunit